MGHHVIYYYAHVDWKLCALACKKYILQMSSIFSALFGSVWFYEWSYFTRVQSDLPERTNVLSQSHNVLWFHAIDTVLEWAVTCYKSSDIVHTFCVVTDHINHLEKLPPLDLPQTPLLNGEIEVSQGAILLSLEYKWPQFVVTWFA